MEKVERKTLVVIENVQQKKNPENINLLGVEILKFRICKKQSLITETLEKLMKLYSEFTLQKRLKNDRLYTRIEIIISMLKNIYTSGRKEVH